ncbi:MAG: sigma-70 family RNA polymerase sigma factor [Bacteroidota bacterium]|nr:sigma-70 family RNA polymerase sigma factor [Bacteroidota bacterium]
MLKDIAKSYQSEWNAFRLFGDGDALSVIYHDNFDLLFNYGRKFCHEDFLIEDAIQNVFTNLIKIRDHCVDIENIKFYLLASFRNELFELIRKNRRVFKKQNFLEIFFKPDDTIEDEMVENENRMHIQAILNKSLHKLTPHQQEIIYLKFEVGLSYEEISKTMNISIESCRSAVYRIIKSLKADIDHSSNQSLHPAF